MHILDTEIHDVKLVQPKRFGDERGWFAEVYNQASLKKAGLPGEFVQDNQSFSTQGVLRGLHYQLVQPQGKLVRCLSGHIWDVAVDLRRDSPDFGKHVGFSLKPLSDSGELQMLWIPEGFAHGFLVLSETAEVLYKTTDYYHPASERCIRWDDPTLAIPWPVEGIQLSISHKDANGLDFQKAELPSVVQQLV